MATLFGRYRKHIKESRKRKEERKTEVIGSYERHEVEVFGTKLCTKPVERDGSPKKNSTGSLLS